MNNKEAIKQLEFMATNLMGEVAKENEVAIKQVEAIDTAQEALKYRSYRNPVHKHYEEDAEEPYIKTVCPNGCRYSLNSSIDKYCPSCGQKIGWEVDE